MEEKNGDSTRNADGVKNASVGATGDAPGAVNGRRRVKLYMLNEERVWHDQGTGHVSPIYSDKNGGLSLTVRSETDSTILLESRIHPKTAYQKQVETLIVWSEHDNDYALSFQEKASCDEIWERICHFQGKDPAVELTQDCAMNSADSSVDDMSSVVDYQDTPLMQDSGPPITLPPCELSKLEEISELFSNTLMTPARRQILASAIEEEGYIKQLLELFHMCEDLENSEGLHHLYDIFKCIFTLNQVELFEEMFEQETIFDVVGVLEYDPSSTTKTKHRDYLRTQAKFKEVVPLGNQKLTEKIHQTYRMQYIQDVMLPAPSVFEENMLSTLSSLIYFNKSSIVTMIQEDDKLLTTLFQQVADDELDDCKRRDLVLFLKEFCAFSQTLQPDSKSVFYRHLIELGILQAIEMVLGFDDHVMKAAAIDVFTFILENCPSTVRDFILQESNHAEDDELLINLVIEQMISDPDPELGGAVQLMGTIKTLIDPENMIKSKNEKTDFLGFFYKHSMHILTAPLFANTANDKPSRDDYQMAQLLALTLELLTFCIEHHAFNMKNYTLSKDLIRRVLVLLKSRHSFLALAALRLVRRVVGLKDDFYNRYLIKGDLFKPIVEAFISNGNKYNLLNSALIELFEFLRTEDIKTLTKYVIEKHWPSFERVDYVATFKQLKLRYDQSEDTSMLDSSIDRGIFKSDFGGTPASIQNSRFRRDTRTLEEEEETWFDHDEYDEADSCLPELKPNLDQIFNRFFVDRKSYCDVKENEAKESPPRIINRNMSPINVNLNLKSSLSPSFSGSLSPIQANPPTTSPANSPGDVATNGGSPVGPTNSPVGSPVTPTNTNKSSPVTHGTKLTTSPVTPLSDKSNTVAAVQTKKPGIVGLVDYPDDEDEEEEDDSSTTDKLPSCTTLSSTPPTSPTSTPPTTPSNTPPTTPTSAPTPTPTSTPSGKAVSPVVPEPITAAASEASVAMETNHTSHTNSDDKHEESSAKCGDEVTDSNGSDGSSEDSPAAKRPRLST